MHSVRRSLLFILAFVVLGGSLMVRAQGPLQFVPILPCRAVDTRITGNPIQGNTFQNFAIQGSQGSCTNIPSSAVAYSFNVTVVPQGPLGYLTVWPSGQAQPGVSTLNSIDGRVKANAAVVAAGSEAGGAVSVYASATTDLVLDIDGYFTAPNGSSLAFYTVAPCRVADTRNGKSLTGGQEADFPISPSCNIPSTAAAYSLNFTVIPKEPLGYLTVWPAGQQQPIVSTLNSPTGTVVANAAMVAAGNKGEVAVFPSNDTDLVIDADGYYALGTSAPGGQSLYTVTPCRVLDTRLTTGAFMGTIPVEMVVDSCGLPNVASAVVVNATVVPQESLGYLTLWPNGQTQPLVSTLNAYDGEITSNLAVTPTTNGFINAFALDSTQLVVDLFDYFAIPSGLNGDYTFTVNGFDGTGPVMMAGSLVADGNGKITGVLDLNSASGGPRQLITFKGTYSVQSNGLGTLVITPPPFNKSMTFSIAVSSTGDGRLVLNNESSSFLPNTWGTGELRMQDSSAFSLQQIAGSFASGFAGVDSSLNRYAGAGVYQITSIGGLTGASDTNDNGVTNSRQTAGQLLSLDSVTGRGTATIVTSGMLSHWVYYVTSANALTFLSIDPIGSPANLLLQAMIRQGNSPFSNASLNGVGVLRTSGVAQAGNEPKQAGAGGLVPDTVAGLLTSDGNGNDSFSFDENVGGTLAQKQTKQGTYSVAANGRATLNGLGSNPPILYLVDSNRGFLVSQDNSVASGYLEPQSGGPFSSASAVGTYWGGSVMPVTAAVTDAVTSAFADGNGNLNVTTNTSGSGGPGSQSFNGVLAVDATGRVTLTESGSLTAVLYVVSPTKVVLLPAIDPNPAISVLGSTN